MLNIGFIGCGGIARAHAGCLEQIRNARIVACTDVVASAGRSFAVDFDVAETFTDYEAQFGPMADP